MMRVSVIGTGYVGLVAAACFAANGHEVLCTDIDEQKVRALNAGKVPIHEPGLEPLVAQNLEDGRLRFGTDNAEAARHGEVIFLAVGTPTGDDGGAPDLTALFAAARQVGEHLDGYTVVVNKSTVPVGTAERVAEIIGELTQAEFSVVSNPEFLKEGSAVNDFVSPDRVIIGVDDERAKSVMERVYRPFFRKGNRVIYMGVRSAELTKYAANAYLATRISFINDIARLCEAIGADVEEVRVGMGSDQRIGNRFLYPGCGYGGSCFPKDTRALVHTAEAHGHTMRLVAGADQINEDQKAWILAKVLESLGPEPAGKTVAVWGLAFKPNTDDVREAPALTLVHGLLDAGVAVRAHDPVAASNFAQALGRPENSVVYVDKPYEAAKGADALVLCTEWGLYRSPDFGRLHALMSGARVFDGRNQWERDVAERAGLQYWGVGR